MRALLNFLNKSWLHKTIGGAPFLMLSLFLIAGPNNAIQIIMISVICTAGIGLLFWVLAAYIIGVIMTTILKSVYDDFPVSETSTTSMPRPVIVADPETAELVKYIQDARAYGFMDSEIEVRLSAAGWSSEKIEKAYKLL